MYQAFLAGSTICDIDPKGDHALERLPGRAPSEMEVIELSPDERYRGMLDPLRIAPEETREDLAYNFLLGILPEPVSPGLADRAAARRPHRGGRAAGARAATSSPSSSAATIDARACARAIGIHGSSGLARLGFATAESQRTRRRGEDGHQPADPQPAAPAARDAARRDGRGGADRPGDPAPARRLRAAAHERRPAAPLRARLRRGVGAARRRGGPHARRPHLAPGARPERHAAARDPGARRHRRARGPDRRGVLLRRRDGGRGAQGAAAAAPRRGRRGRSSSA